MKKIDITKLDSYRMGKAIESIDEVIEVYKRSNNFVVRYSASSLLSKLLNHDGNLSIYCGNIDKIDKNKYEEYMFGGLSFYVDYNDSRGSTTCLLDNSDMMLRRSDIEDLEIMKNQMEILRKIKNSLDEIENVLKPSFKLLSKF